MLSCPMGHSQQTLQHGAPTQLILCEREGLYRQCQKYKSTISAASGGYAAEIIAISYCKITVNAMHVFFRPPQHSFAPSHHDMSPMQSLVKTISSVASVKPIQIEINCIRSWQLCIQSLTPENNWKLR